MSVGLTSSKIFLALLWTLTYMIIAKVKAGASSIGLDVSHTRDPIQHSELLVINCSLDANLANMKTVATLKILGSKPYGPQGEFEQLAAIDMWSQTPRLSRALEDSGAIVSGETGPGYYPKQSYLMLYWNSPTSWYREFYKCLANGIDSKGQAESVDTTVKVQLVGLGGGCCKSMDLITSELRLLSGNLGNTSGAVGEVLQHVETLPKRFEALEAKLEKFRRSVSIQLQRLAIDKGKFDLSGSFRDRFYIVSKQEAAFNIGQANQLCQDAGGYLLEIDDDEEFQIVYDFVTRIGGSNNFWTGGNDRDKEGTFVYFNSKKPVPKLSGWSDGQPNDHGSGEDCMEIRLSLQGLNDLVCSHVGKFVCEVPLQ